MKYLNIALFLLLLVSCKHDPIVIIEEMNEDPDPTDPIVIEHDSCDGSIVYFNEQVLPIFISSCAVSECHNQESHEDDLILDSYVNILVSGEIVPFDTSEGDIYEVITLNQNNNDFMPPTDSGIPALSSEEIDLIAGWINQGLPNNSCPDLVCDTLEVTFSGDIAPMIDSYCSGCHTGTNVSGDVYLSNYTEIKNKAESGAIFGSISNSPSYAVMPPNTLGLSECQARMIEIWVEEGALDN